MNKLILSALLLSTASLSSLHATENQPADQMQMLDQGTYMAELYQNIVDFCKTHESPSTILLAIPLDLIFVTRSLPQEMQDRITAFSQAIEKNDMASLDSDAAMKLVGQLIPFMELVDTRIAVSIQELQALGVHMLAISPFMPQHADAVLARLQDSGIDFNVTALFTKKVTLDDEAGNIIGLSTHGVLFLNDYFQGSAALEALLQKTRVKIEHLFFAAPTAANPAEQE